MAMFTTEISEDVDRTLFHQARSNELGLAYVRATAFALSAALDATTNIAKTLLP